MREQLKPILDGMVRISSENGPKGLEIASEVLTLALSLECCEGLTFLCREGDPNELVVFETDNPNRDINYGGVGEKASLKVVGGDGPLTFVIAMVVTAKAIGMPRSEAVAMLASLAKASFSRYHESKEERDER